MARTATVTGFREIDDKLATMLPKLQKKAIRKATRAAAKIVFVAAKALAPVDEGEYEGALKVRAMKRSRKQFGHAVVADGKHFEEQRFHGPFVEFGTAERFHGSGKSVGVMEADPVLRPAAYGNEQRVKSVFTNELRQGVRELAR